MRRDLVLAVVVTAALAALSALSWQLVLNPRLFSCGCPTADGCCH